MSEGALHVSLDQGGHSSRAIAFDARGDVIASTRREVSTTRRSAGRVEQDPEALAASIRECLDELCEKLGPDASRIANLGLATQRSSLVCWNARTGETLSPVLSWQDRRAADWLAGHEPHAARVREITGLFLSPHYGASKFAWCLRELPEVQSALRAGELRMGPIASFLAGRLLPGQPPVVDPCNAGRTLLFDLRKLDWSPELLELFGVPREVLPSCATTASSFGPVSTPAGELPLEILSGDQPAALFASGKPLEDAVYVNLGTGAFVLRFLESVEEAPARMLASVSYSDAARTRLVVEGTVNGAASALNHAASELGLSQWEDQLDDWLREATEPTLYLNGVAGLGSPFWVPELESRWVGSGSVAARMAGVAESILFLVQRNLDELVTISPSARVLRVTGGLSNSSALCQRLADLCALRIERPVVREATARGTAFWLAGQPRDWLELGAPTVFEPQENPGLRERYARWLDCMNEALS